MIKIVSVIGTAKSQDSVTENVVNKLISEISSRSKNRIENITLKLADYKINECVGCLQCFKSCRICDRYDDDIKKIDLEINDADIIVFASPVYAHNITGKMKNFIDRIAYGLHIMKFLGKYGIVVSTSASNGNYLVEQYLTSMMIYFGMKPISTISISMVKGGINNIISDSSEKIVNIIDGVEIRKSTDYEEQVFQTMKKAMVDLRTKVNTKETLYWEKKGYFEGDSFEELFELACRK